MVSTVYDGNTLVSVSYCKRKLIELTAEHTLVSLSPLNLEKKRRIGDEILLYTRIKEELERVSVEQWISFVKTEMVDKVKKSGMSPKTISFSYISLYTVMINIHNIFSTEITFSKTVYSVEYVPNEYYDGSMSNFVDMRVAKPTAFLEQFKIELQNELGI